MPDKAPPKKPKRFKPMLDMLNTEAAVGTLAPKTYVDLVSMFSRKAYENGELEVDEYLDIVKPLFGETGEKVTNKIKEYEDELEKYADGGRAQFGIGSLNPDAELSKRVIELMEDKENPLSFGEAVKQAMEETRKDQGSGTMPKSEKWMREYFFDGKGGYDDRMSYKEFALGPGQELYKKFGND